MPTGRWGRLIVGSIIITAATSSAASLVDDLRQFFRSPDTIGPALQHLAARSIEMPTTSMTPGLTFRYDPEHGTFAPSDESLGPVFVERAETVGVGHASVAFTYQYGDFDRFDGDDFTMKQTVSGSSLGATAVGHTVADISIPINEFVFSATYGITSNWDVDLFVPLLYSRVRVTTQESSQIFFGSTAPLSFLPPRSFNEGSFGVGDILLRTKYRLGSVDDFGFALGLVWGMPTGDPDDFRGTGDWTVEPLVIVSRDFGRANVHMNVGMDFD